MGRAPCCSKEGLHKGPWSTKEDMLLTNYIQAHGEGQWRSLPKRAGLLRCGKSCRLRWLNYLRPGIKRGNITPDEEDLIIRLQSLLGNRWSLIAGRLPGRTDNEIKNHWNTNLMKRLKKEGIEPKAQKYISKPSREPERKTNKATRWRKRNQPEKPKKHNESDDSGKDEVTVGKVYLPKPIRISPGFTASCNSVVSACTDSVGSVGSSSQQQQEVDKEAKIKESYIPWSSFHLGDTSNVHNERIHLCDDDDETLLFNCDLSLQDVQKLYDEYLQLL